MQCFSINTRDRGSTRSASALRRGGDRFETRSEITVSSHCINLVQIFYLVIEHQPTMSLILHSQVAENNLEADEKGL